MFKKHIKGAHDAGLKVGVYFFTEAINAKEGKEEAAYTLNLVRNVGIPLSYPVAIDTEAVGGSKERAKNLSKAKRTEAIKGFCEEIKAQGYEPMIYASTSWLDNKLDMSKLPYKVWVAQYNDKVTYKGSYVLWQFTSRANISGVKGYCDVSKPYFKDEAPKVETPKEEKPQNETAVKSRTDLMRAWNKKIANDNRLHYKKWDKNDKRTQTCPICDGTLDLYEHLPTGVFKKGSTGEAVKYIQKFLKNFNGAKIDVDGIYGEATENAVKAFQKKAKIIYDGIWGPNTAKAAKKIIEKYLGWNCIGAAAASIHHGMGLPTNCNCHVIAQDKNGHLDLYDAKTDEEALKLAQKKFGTKELEVIRSTKNIPKKKWKIGDYCCMFKGDKFTHAFVNDGDDKVFDSTQSGGIGSKNNIAIRNNQNYSCKVIIRFKEK